MAGHYDNRMGPENPDAHYQESTNPYEQESTNPYYQDESNPYQEGNYGYSTSHDES